MSFDLAVWESRLSDGRDVNEVYDELIDRLEAASAIQPASPAIKEFAHELLTRWPDGEGDRLWPWASTPVMNEASGPMIYLVMRYSAADEAVPIIAAIAKQHGLVCYDPQAERAV